MAGWNADPLRCLVWQTQRTSLRAKQRHLGGLLHPSSTSPLRHDPVAKASPQTSSMAHRWSRPLRSPGAVVCEVTELLEPVKTHANVPR